MSFRNWQTPAGTPVIAATGNCNFVGLQFITAGSVTYVDSLNNTVTLAAVGQGTVILGQIVSISAYTGTILGMQPS